MNEAQTLACVALEAGYPCTTEGDRLVVEGQEFTLKDHRLFSPRWMEPKRNDAKSKKLVAEALEYQAAGRRNNRDKRIAELEEQLLEMQSNTEE